jgi:hypothetical protein
VFLAAFPSVFLFVISAFLRRDDPDPVLRVPLRSHGPSALRP